MDGNAPYPKEIILMMYGQIFLYELGASNAIKPALKNASQKICEKYPDRLNNRSHFARFSLPMNSSLL
jgi:hypothetical protein